MMKKIFLVSLIAISLLLACILSSCEYGLDQLFYRKDGVNERWENPLSEFTDLGTIYSTSLSKYSFFIFTDIHFGKKNFSGTEGILSFLKKYSEDNAGNEEKKLRFALFLGDVADTASEKEFLDWKKLDEEISAFILPNNPAAKNIFTILGNHDVFNNGLGLWKKYCFPHKSAFRFSVATSQGVRNYYSFDSSNSIFGSDQLDFWDKVLRLDAALGIRQTVMTHSPLHQHGTIGTTMITTMDNYERMRTIQLLSETNTDFYLSGHVHCGGIYDFSKFHDICFKSHVNEYGGSSFYTATIDEFAKKMTVFKYNNFNWAVPEEIREFFFN